MSFFILFCFVIGLSWSFLHIKNGSVKGLAVDFWGSSGPRRLAWSMPGESQHLEPEPRATEQGDGVVTRKWVECNGYGVQNVFYVRILIQFFYTYQSRPKPVLRSSSFCIYFIRHLLLNHICWYDDCVYLYEYLYAKISERN